ncbi:CGNR zinc finger domain-containing protein [Glycomyces sp. NPDC021274]|uniref:CGNR zinc finger domain-containing protein n=1 Tax=Glycomyces sp. NPDC021274 TaxID=3155120 RepID=UPI0033D28548
MTVTRPLMGEPLPLDLLDTVWMENGSLRDVFDTPGALEGWLAEHEFSVDAPAREVREHLTEARESIRAFLAKEDDGEARLNAVLAHGTRNPRLVDGRPAIEDSVDGPAHLPGWKCAVELLDLLERKGDRIRKCANHECVLWYLDTTRNGSRRWHSMETCGNRAKAKRFQDRHA